jgi:hypothetical protein
MKGFLLSVVSAMNMDIWLRIYFSGSKGKCGSINLPKAQMTQPNLLQRRNPMRTPINPPLKGILTSYTPTKEIQA